MGKLVKERKRAVLEKIESFGNFGVLGEKNRL